jgi:Predicted integral membrane protein (DUF2269)
VSAYEIGLLAHLLGALLAFGGVLVAAVAFESGRRRSLPSEIALVLGLARIGALIVVAGTILVLTAGLWLANDTGQLDEPWLLASLGLFAGSVVLGAAGGQRPKRARVLAAELAAEGRGETEELRRLLVDPLTRALNYASALLFLAVLVLMVWQPGR